MAKTVRKTTTEAGLRPSRSASPGKTPWSEILDEGRGDERLVRTARYGARPAKPEPLPDYLSPALLEALERTGVDKLWSHQAAALESAWQGPTIVTTAPPAARRWRSTCPGPAPRRPTPTPRPTYFYPPRPPPKAKAAS